MTTGVVLAAVSACLFGVAYISKRRFGTLVLAMAAGVVVSGYATPLIVAWLDTSHVTLGSINTATVVAMGIILIPSLVLLFGGPVYATKRWRLIGSLLYATTALMMSLASLKQSLVLVGQEQTIFSYVWKYHELAISVLLTLALVDVFLIHTARRSKHAE